ncbi:Major facilitator superfamily domain general substrate transporter, partial [Penicillium verhagenii]
MSAFFGKAELPTETHPAMDKHDSDTDTQSQKNGNSKPSSEKESTLVDEPIQNITAPDDTNKEATAFDLSRTNHLNQGSHKELMLNNDSEKEASSSQGKEESDNPDMDDHADNTEYPSAWRLLLITIALCLCVFCVALDNTIIATAIPKITDQFNSLDDVG